MKKFSRMIFGIILVFAVVIACEGPSGSEGPQGPQGEAGPIGPAGEDGSVMYAGPDAPTADIGNEGDYYLNTNTGEYYGPKDSDGWGNPIIVLMGEDGADGQDGEDGSQIYSGNGAPAATLGVEGDYYLDKDSYELYGPKTNTGWGSPLNLKGADGNANVTRYIFPGHDFSNSSYTFLEIPEVESSEEMKNSSWNVYLRDSSTYYHIPGVVNPDYLFSVYHYMSNGTMSFTIDMREGVGRNFDQIEVIRVESTNTVDHRKQKGDSIIPDDLDTSDYEAIAEYYGFYK